MVTKKLFALASVSAIAGLMTTVTASGCSSTTTETSSSSSGGTDSGPKDATPDRKTITDDDSGDTTSDCPKSVPLTADDLDKEIGFKPPKASPGACSSADLTQLEANFKDTNLKTYFDLGKSMSDACVACVFSKDTDTNWGPIVGTASDNGMTGFINFGACFAEVENADCGKALQYEQFCYNVACNACTTSSTDRQKCVQTAGDTGMCKDFGNTTQTACPNIQTSAKSCNAVTDGAKVLCGSGISDAGKG
jgi:hypothetical protein